MKFIKKNINIILGVLILVLILGVGIFLKVMFFPSDSKVIYGNRLEGIEKVKIKDSKIKDMKKAISDTSKSVNIRIAGRIIYVDTVVNKDVNLETAKGYGNKILELLSEEEKNYYDVQLMIDKEDSSQFPIIGYKHHANAAIIWTKDRAES